MTNKRLQLVCLAALLGAMTIASYWPVHTASFVDFDDGEYIYGNQRVATGLTAHNLAWAITESHSFNWHPLTWFSHMLDVEFFGLDARGHHAVSVLLHTANAILLFLTLTWMTGSSAPSFFVAAVFAIHPTNVESVAWVAQRKTLLATFFALVCIAAYSRYAVRGSKAMYAFSLGAFALSLTAKQMYVTMPLLLWLLDDWPLNRNNTPSAPKTATRKKPDAIPINTSRADVRNSNTVPSRKLLTWRVQLLEKLPYLVLAALASMATIVAQQDAIRSVDSHPLALRLGNVLRAYIDYLRLTFWPTDLSVFYPLEPKNITLASSVLSLTVLLVLTAVARFVGRRRRYWFVGWFWFLITLIPVIGLVQVGAQARADRYMYFTTVGLWIIVAWTVRDLLAKWTFVPARQIAVVTAALLGIAVGTLYAWQTHRRVLCWHDSIALFEDALSKNPENRLAHRVLAGQYFASKDYPQTIQHCETALKLDSRNSDVLGIYGLALFETGARDKAVLVLQKAIETDPGDVLSRTNLGWIHAQQGQYDAAEAHLRAAAQSLTPASAIHAHQNVYANWGHVLNRLGRPDEAAEKLNTALQWDPNSVVTLCEAAEAELLRSKDDAAIGHLRTALALDPQDLRARFLLATALVRREQFPEAAENFERVASANPTNFEAADQAARLYARIGQPADRDRVLRHNFIALNNLAWTLATAKNASQRAPEQAIVLATRACDLSNHADPESLGTLGAAYAAAGQFSKAVQTANRALDLAKQTNHPAATQIQQQLNLYLQNQPFVEE